MSKGKKGAQGPQQPLAQWDGKAPIKLPFKRLMSPEFKNIADVVFMVEGKPIYSTMGIISVRWTSMLTSILERKAKDSIQKDPQAVAKHRGPIHVVDHTTSFAIMWVLLKFIHTSRINFMKLSIPQIVELTNCAAHAKLDRLRNLCEKHVQSILSMETVFTLMKYAHQTNSLTIKAMCLEWALFHYAEFVGNKQGLAVLGLELFQETVTELAPQIAVRDKVSIIRLPHTPPDTIYSDYQKLYEQMALSDAVAVVGGQKIRFHRCILAVQSPVLHQWIAANADKLYDGVAFKDLSPEGFVALLKFCYYGDTNIDPGVAAELVRGFCTQYQCWMLKAVCEVVLQTKISSNSAVKNLYVTYLPENQNREDMKDLRQQLLIYLGSHIVESDLSDISSLPWPITFDMLIALQQYVKANPQAAVSAPQMLIPPSPAHSAPGTPTTQHRGFVPGIKSPRDEGEGTHTTFGPRRPQSQNDSERPKLTLGIAREGGGANSPARLAAGTSPAPVSPHKTNTAAVVATGSLATPGPLTTGNANDSNWRDELEQMARDDGPKSEPEKWSAVAALSSSPRVKPPPSVSPRAPAANIPSPASPRGAAVAPTPSSPRTVPANGSGRSPRPESKAVEPVKPLHSALKHDSGPPGPSSPKKVGFGEGAPAPSSGSGKRLVRPPSPRPTGPPAAATGGSGTASALSPKSVKSSELKERPTPPSPKPAPLALDGPVPSPAPQAKESPSSKDKKEKKEKKDKKSSGDSKDNDSTPTTSAPSPTLSYGQRRALQQKKGGSGTAVSSADS